MHICLAILAKVHQQNTLSCLLSWLHDTLQQISQSCIILEIDDAG